MFLAIVNVICHNVMGAYVNLMIGYPLYTLFSFRVIIESLTVATYIDMKYKDRDMRDKLNSDEYLHFSIHRFKNDITRYLGSKLTSKACKVHDELSSLWMHPIAGLKLKEGRKPAGQALSILRLYAASRNPPSYLYPPPYSYEEHDVLFLKHLEHVAEDVEELMYAIYSLWCNHFHVSPCVKIKE